MDSSLVFSPFVLLFANALMIDEKKGEALNEDRTAETSILLGHMAVDQKFEGPPSALST